MADFYRYLLLVDYTIYFCFNCFIIVVTSKILYHIMFCQRSNSVRIIPILTAHVVSWWLSAVFGLPLAFYNVVFWRPEPIYNVNTLFSFILAALITLNCVHISRFFITFERLLIVKFLNPENNQKLMLVACSVVNIGVSLFIGVYFIQKFIEIDHTTDNCSSFPCMVGMDTYLISYHITNGISLANLIASVYFLLLFRKSSNNLHKTDNHSSKLQNTVKFIIFCDIIFDVVPQILIILLDLIGSPLTSSVASIQRVLFTFCGVFVNRRFYKVFVVNENSSALKSCSNEAAKTQSKGIQSSKAVSTVTLFQQ